ncbi:MAG: tryptophan-rich sensory protein [Deltaproteobacteria bacterium]|nr:tryptophan-rich sensory protein [Deltaproteobacteria bacterium]
MNAWYEGLKKPPLTPPNWVFGPVWTIIYIMIASSLYLYLRTKPKQHPEATVILLVIHLISNFIWTVLFFGLQSPLLAFFDIFVLDLSLAVLIFLFKKANRIAAALLLPYGLWVGFATYLNLGFFLLNRT